jgi:hypothetical protein
MRNLCVMYETEKIIITTASNQYKISRSYRDGLGKVLLYREALLVRLVDDSILPYKTAISA